MISKEKLLERFEGILDLEQTMKKEYDEHIEKLKDEDVLKRLKTIRDQEAEHIELAKKLLDIVKSAS